MNKPKKVKNKDGMVYTYDKESTSWCKGCIFIPFSVECQNAPPCDGIIFTKVDEAKQKHPTDKQKAQANIDIRLGEIYSKNPKKVNP